MVTLFKEYGSLAVSVAAFSLLMVFLFGVSGSGFLYRMADMGEEIQAPYSDTWNPKELGGILGQEEPVVWLENPSGGCLAGMAYDLADLVKGQDAQGNELEIRICDVRDAGTGQSVFLDAAGGQKQDGKRFTFPRRGIYDIELLAVDQKNIVTEKTIDIPVKGGRK